MIVLLLGDLDSNQEWRIQSPLFCQLNYLPLRTINIPQALKYFKLYLTLIKCSPPELCLTAEAYASSASDASASLMRRIDSAWPSISMVSNVGGETF